MVIDHRYASDGSLWEVHGDGSVREIRRNDMGSEYMWGDILNAYVTSHDRKDSALTRQVGGDHYKKQGASMQPWAIIDAWGLDFYAGNVLKYLLRHQYKDGVEDLKKARHYLDRMIEKEEQKALDSDIRAGKYDENPS